jgi:hypothetical protein
LGVDVGKVDTLAAFEKVEGDAKRVNDVPNPSGMPIAITFWLDEFIKKVL